MTPLKVTAVSAYILGCKLLLPLSVLFASTSISLVNSHSNLGISSKLRNYGTLHMSDLTGVSSLHRVKRDAPTHGPQKPNAIEKITLTTAGRQFNLILTEDRNIFGPDFKVTEVNKDGEEVEMDFTPHTFYKGIVKGEANSEVLLYWESDTAVNAKISTQEDIYYIEPSYPHLPNSNNYSMISYKASDLIVEAAPYGDHCGGVKHGKTIPAGTEYSGENNTHRAHHSSQHEQDNHNRRKKRQASGTVNTCGLLLVVDTRFLQEIMGDDKARANNYVVNLVTRVNSIYRKTNFEGHEQFGFQIDRIKIHDTYSTDPNHYNYGNRNIEIPDDPSAPNPVNTLLDAFGRVDKTGHTDYTNYCLAHLFTAYAFQNGVLGLAYIASSSTSTYGGICSKSYYDSALGADIYLNTGWSSALNRKSEKILTQEAEIVLAHELGHNWGSEHDPETSDCAPPDSEGGKHIMYTYAVSGFHVNNRLFSSCSRRFIGSVLRNKKSLCFKEMSSPTEGNFRRDPGEDCDAGKEGDTCCTAAQKYTPYSDCSITNDVCCTMSDEWCTIRGARDKQCATESVLTCVANSTCDGASPNCTVKHKDEGDYCQDEYGRCLVSDNSPNTECEGFPEVVGLTKCTCAAEEDECKLCHSVDDESCIVFDPSTLGSYVENCGGGYCTVKSNKARIKEYDVATLTGGYNYILLVNSTCEGGYCNVNGTCIRQSTDIVARFWDFLTHLDSNAVVEFMESNIVGTVAVFSFILWLPCVIAVYCYDKKQAKTAKLEDQAFRSIRRHHVEDSRIINRPLVH